MKNRVSPTTKQKKAYKEIVENGRNLGEGMIEAGYSENTAKAPTKMTKTKGWEQLMKTNLPDKDLAKVHKQLLSSTRIEHMVFPLDIEDKEIINLLGSVNCIVRKFQHSETQTHVWFWCSNDKSRKEALDMAYKLKGRYKEKPLVEIRNHFTNVKITIDDNTDLPLAQESGNRLHEPSKV